MTEQDNAIDFVQSSNKARMHEEKKKSWNRRVQARTITSIIYEGEKWQSKIMQ